jgi:serine/threonine protein kinase
MSDSAASSDIGKDKPRRFMTRFSHHASRRSSPVPKRISQKLSRKKSFNAGDRDPSSAAVKAAAEGYDPLGLLKLQKPSVSGQLKLKSNSIKVFGKWDDYWAELRGGIIIFYPSKPTVTTWSPLEWTDIDITSEVHSLLCILGCQVLIEKKKDKVIRLTRNGDSVHFRFDDQTLFDEWCAALLQLGSTSAPCLSDFEIIAPIGKGAAGKVFLVRHTATGRKMALKAIEKESNVFDSRSSYRHAIDERMVLSLTEGDPLFVQLRYAFQTEKCIYLATDFYDGGDLFFYLAANQCGFDEDRTRFIVAEIVLAMERIHQLDVIYRDLKPENILLDAPGHIRIADFGLCKRMDKGLRIGRTGTICGTHSYVAPEMVSAKSYGASVDIFTIGIFMYHIMVGRPPFDASDMEDVRVNVAKLSEIPYYDDFMSPEAISLLKSILDPNPETRLGCSDEGASALKAHPFFAKINWEQLRQRVGCHEGGLFTGGFEIPPGMSKSSHAPDEDSENINPNKEPSNIWYKPDPNDDDHLLRNFDVKEWEGVKVEDEDDSGRYGDAQLWPVFKFHKRDLHSSYVVGYTYCSVK